MKKFLTILLFFLLLPLTVNAQSSNLLLENEQASYSLASYTVTRTNTYDQIDSIYFVVDIAFKQNTNLKTAQVSYSFDLSHQDKPIAGNAEILLPTRTNEEMRAEIFANVDKHALLEKALEIAEANHQQMPYNEKYYFWRENNLVATYLDGNLSKPEFISLDNELQVLDVYIVSFYTDEGAAKINTDGEKLMAFKENYRFDLVNNRYMLMGEIWQYETEFKEVKNLNTDWQELYPATPDNNTILAQSILTIGLMYDSYDLDKASLPLTFKDIANWSPQKYDINLKQ